MMGEISHITKQRFWWQENAGAKTGRDRGRGKCEDRSDELCAKE